MSRIGVVGGGAWGTALATAVARAGGETLVWAREPEVVEAINSRHENTVFLPGVALDPAITATSDLAAMADVAAVLMVTPAQALRAVAGRLAPHLHPGCPVALCAKGIESNGGLLMSEVLGEVVPEATPLILSGPSFAADVARGLPTAVTLAAADRAVADDLARAIGSATFRPYVSGDIIGAQIGGAIKNVLAIACGIVDGRALGASARAALITRGFAEMIRFGRAKGADPSTMNGLSGLGDLVLTCSSPQSRNMSLGIALGQGQSLGDILAARNSVSEGVHSAAVVSRLAETLSVEMPICDTVHRIVDHGADIGHSIDALLARPLRRED